MPQVVVVVNDDELTCSLVREALGGAGYAVDAYGSCVEAFAGLLLGAPAVACIVDETLDDMKGTDLVRSLRGARDPRLRAMPVVGLGSRSCAELLAAGADEALAAPFTDGAIVAAVQRAVRIRAGHSPR